MGLNYFPPNPNSGYYYRPYPVYLTNKTYLL